MTQSATLGFLAAGVLFLGACSNGDQSSTDAHASGLEAIPASYIPVDSANKMISSYLGSVQTVDSAVHSLILDADDIRAYLQDTSIRKVKIMLAHKLDYINAGNADVPAGYNYGAFTLIMAGYNALGNYVLAPGNNVINRVSPCPVFCPEAGSAQNDLITTH